MSDINDTSRNVKKLSSKDIELLSDRLYTKSVQARAASIKAAEARFYPVAAPKTISKETLESTAVRNATTEMQRRKEKMTLLEERYNKSEQKRLKRSQEEIDDSVHRMYEQSMKTHQMKMEALKKECSINKDKGHKLTRESQLNMANRLCKPKKKEYTDEEFNAVYGL